MIKITVESGETTKMKTFKTEASCIRFCRSLLEVHNFLCPNIRLKVTFINLNRSSSGNTA